MTRFTWFLPTFGDGHRVGSAAVAATTERLRLLVAFRTGFTLPTLLAQQAEAFQLISGGRLALNAVTGGDPVEQRTYGDFLDHDERYGASPAAEADRMLAGMEPERIAAAQARFARMDPVGQARTAALHEGAAADLEISPNLWAGIGLVREGAGTALVGSYAEVAARIDQYAALGLDEFILSGWPHLEEAYRVGENVLPLVASR